MLEAEVQTEEQQAAPDTHSRGTNTGKTTESYYGQDAVVLTHDFFHEILFEMCKLTMKGAESGCRFVRPDKLLFVQLLDQRAFPKTIKFPTEEDLQPGRTRWSRDSLWEYERSSTRTYRYQHMIC